MKWNAIHHDLHLSVLAGVGGVLAVILATPHPAAHRVLHLRAGRGRRGREGDWKRDDANGEEVSRGTFPFIYYILTLSTCNSLTLGDILRSLRQAEKEIAPGTEGKQSALNVLGASETGGVL